MKNRLHTLMIILLSLLIVTFIGGNRVHAQVDPSRLSHTQGLMIDLARHPLTSTEIEAVINTAKQQNMDYVQLHLSDNENVCFQSDYLGNTASDTVLSKDALTELVDYANGLDIQLIADIDFPSHMQAMLTLLQQSHPDVYDQIVMDAQTIDYTKVELSSALFENIAGELIDIFKNQPNLAFMTGGDEVPGGEAAYITLIDFYNAINDYLNANDFTMQMWNDSIAHSEIDRLNANIVISYWQQAVNGLTPDEIVASGHEIVNSSYYAAAFMLYNLTNQGAVDYFVNYLNQTYQPNVFYQRDTNGNLGTSTTSSIQSNGTTVCLWGEDSAAITINDITSFVAQLKIPK